MCEIVSQPATHKIKRKNKEKRGGKNEGKDYLMESDYFVIWKRWKGSIYDLTYNL